MNQALASSPGADSGANVGDRTPSSPCASSVQAPGVSCLRQRSYFSGSPSSRQQQQDGEARHGLIEAAAYDVASGSDAFGQQELQTIHFYLAVRSIITRQHVQMPRCARWLPSAASHGVEEIFKMGEDRPPKISLTTTTVKLPTPRSSYCSNFSQKAIGVGSTRPSGL